MGGGEVRKDGEKGRVGERETSTGQGGWLLQGAIVLGGTQLGAGSEADLTRAKA